MNGIAQANLDFVLATGARGVVGHNMSGIFGAHGQSLMDVMVSNLGYHGGVPRCPSMLADVMLVTRRVCLQPDFQLLLHSNLFS